jgi:probable phosphomutase (TIGR03848 family)
MNGRMLTLLLIRHGENDYFARSRLPGHAPGISLNLRGREQAAALARNLSSLQVRAVYSSPLERCIETAQPLADSLGLQIKILPDLIDTNVGDWTGRSWKALRRTKLWKDLRENPAQFQFPGGETFVNLQRRVIHALEIICTEHLDGLIAVVFHSDPIKLVVAHYLGLPLDSFQRLTVDPGSVTILRLEKPAAKLLALNLIPPFTVPAL